MYCKNTDYQSVTISKNAKSYLLNLVVLGLAFLNESSTLVSALKL